MSAVVHPFGCRIVAKLPKLHSQVLGKSFGNRYAEGTFCSQHCLIHPSYTAGEIAKIHTQDVADDSVVSVEQHTQTFTRSQTLALEAAQAATQDLISHVDLAVPVLLDPTIYTPSPPSISLCEIINDLPAALPMSPQAEFPPTRARTNTPGGLPRLDNKLADLTEYDIAKTMAIHNFTFVLPPHYRSPILSGPLGEMIVTVKSAVKLGKEKSAVWVQILAPPTHEGFKMQLYPRSHEPSRGVGQGQDFSILSALAVTSPRASTI